MTLKYKKVIDIYIYIYMKTSFIAYMYSVKFYINCT